MKQLFNNLILMSLFLLAPAAFAAGEENDGYDVNTEESVSGRVTAIHIGTRGPLIVSVQSANRTYAIYTGPSWFWNSSGTDIQENTHVDVTGSKLIARDGSIRIICLYMTNLDTGKTTVFRDNALMPLWRGGGKKGSYGNGWGGRK